MSIFNYTCGKNNCQNGLKLKKKLVPKASFSFFLPNLERYLFEILKNIFQGLEYFQIDHGYFYEHQNGRIFCK
jgi:hypothetical protein